MFSRKCSELNEIKRRLVNLLVGEFPFVPNGKHSGQLKRNSTAHILPLFLHSNFKSCDLLIHYSFSNWAIAIQYGTGHKPNLPEVKGNIPRTIVISICLFNISHLQKSKHLTERKRLLPISQLKMETYKVDMILNHPTVDTRVSVELASYNKYFHFWSMVPQICQLPHVALTLPTSTWHILWSALKSLKCYQRQTINFSDRNMLLKCPCELMAAVNPWPAVPFLDWKYMWKKPQTP